MTLNDLFRRLKEHHMPLTANESQVLQTAFGRTKNIEQLICSPRDFIFKVLDMEPEYYILHEDGAIDKRIPKNGETYFGLYYIKVESYTTYLIIKPENEKSQDY